MYSQNTAEIPVAMIFADPKVAKSLNLKIRFFIFVDLVSIFRTRLENDTNQILFSLTTLTTEYNMIAVISNIVPNMVAPIPINETFVIICLVSPNA